MEIDGRGTGEWRKLSVSIPANVRANMKNMIVYKFDTDAVRCLLSIFIN